MLADHRFGLAAPAELGAIVYARSRELALGHEVLDSGTVALELLDVARGSQSTLEHAFRIAERQLARSPGDVRARLAVCLIDAAIRFLGPPNVRTPFLAARS